MTSISERSPKAQFIFLLAANYLSWFGNAVTIVAVPLLVLSKTGSPFQTGIAGLANTLPMIFAGVVGGVLVDRLGVRRVSVVSDLLAAVATIAVPVLQDSLSMVMLCVLVFVRALADTPAATGKLSQLGLLSDAARVRPETANTLYQAAPRLALVLGTPVGALLVSVIGAAQTLYVDAGSFLIAALLVFVGVSAPVGKLHAPDKPSFARQLAEGFAFVRATRVIGAIIAVVVVTNFIDDSFTPVLLPVYARNFIGDQRVVGWLLAAAGVGAVIGTFLYAPASRRVLRNRRATFIGCFAVVAMLRAAMATLPGWQVMALVAFGIGLASGPLNPIVFTVMQERVPESLRGRVVGLTNTLAFSAAPLGILAAGWSSGALGLQSTLVIFAVLYFVLVAAALLSRSLADLNTGTVDPEGVSGVVATSGPEATGGPVAR
jgi:MFS family permease